MSFFMVVSFGEVASTAIVASVAGDIRGTPLFHAARRGKVPHQERLMHGVLVDESPHDTPQDGTNNWYPEVIVRARESDITAEADKRGPESRAEVTRRVDGVARVVAEGE